jgi:putative spermidine/putrescine transport system ATP-binding protein
VETEVPVEGDHAPGVELQGVTKRFGDQAAVDGVDLVIEGGEFFTLLGPSGSGKTTLLRLIAGFERLDAGRIALHGRDVSGLPPYQREVNTVFQDYALFPHLTVMENVEYGLRVRHVARARRRERVAASLEMVHLGQFGGRKPSQLSGGQRQRVALARAIVNEPKVLLLDEPLGALDLKLRQEMQVELKRIQREVGITFVYVTHDQEEALTMSDRLAVFKDGRIEQVGLPIDVYEQPATRFVASFVGTSNVITTDAGPAILRPERLHFSSGEVRSGHDSATGVVVDVAYLGMVTRITVRLTDGAEMTGVRQNLARGGAHDAIQPGDAVTISWDPSEAFVLTQPSEPATQLGLTTKGAR